MSTATPPQTEPVPQPASDVDQRVLWGMLLVSLGLHAGTVEVLPWLERATDGLRRPETVEMAVLIEQPEEEPAAVAETAPEPEPEVVEPEPEIVQPPARRPRADEPEPPPPSDEPPAPAQETPVDFTGVTLTNDSGGAGWSSAVGNGEDIQGPVGRPGQTTGRRRDGRMDGAPGGTGDAPALVAVGDLSSRPEPPANLSSLLQREYPDQAKAQGLEGRARVRVRVGADGRVRVLATLSEDPVGMGFGSACRRLMQRGGAWSAPRDRNGRPVATVVRFDCNFAVR